MYYGVLVCTTEYQFVLRSIILYCEVLVCVTGRFHIGHLGAGSGAILRQSSQPIRHKAGHKGGTRVDIRVRLLGPTTPPPTVFPVLFFWFPLTRFKPSRRRLKNILDVRAAEIDVQGKLADFCEQMEGFQRHWSHDPPNLIWRPLCLATLGDPYENHPGHKRAAQGSTVLCPTAPGTRWHKGFCCVFVGERVFRNTHMTS